MTLVRASLPALIALALAASSAAAATIAISPATGPVGTQITFSGAAPECAGAGQGAEVFLLVGNFAGGAAVNPRTRVTVGALPGARFSGRWALPSPLTSADPRAPQAGVRAYEVSVRCVDAAGAHSSGAIVEAPPRFTFTSLRPPRDRCPNIAGTQGTIPAGMVLSEAGTCVAPVRGGREPDVLRGRTGADVILGLGGADRISGLAGRDRLVGGAGGDRLIGGAGRDELAGGGGSDSLDARDRAAGDTVLGGAGRDTCLVDRGDVVRGCERVVRA